MKLLRIFITIFLLLSLLTGCTGHLSENAAPSTEPATLTTQPTEPPTTEPATEPPTAAPAKRPLTAQSLFYKAKAAAPDPATQYRTGETIILRAGANGITVQTDISKTMQVFLSQDPFAIFAQTDTVSTMMGVEVKQTLQEYYRQEGEDIVYYCDIEQLDLTVREVLPEQLYPPIDTEEFPDVEIPTNTEWLFTVNSKNGYPPEAYAQYMELEPETQMLDGTEVYVLKYEQNGLWLFDFTGDAAIDADLSSIRIPTTWYIDAETFMPIKQEFTMTDLDSVATAAMVEFLNIQLPENAADLELEIVEYTYTLTDMCFDPVDVPDVPEEVVSDAQSASAYATV